MKSARESALLNTSRARPGKVSMPEEATKILVKLERAKAYGSKRKYNKELDKLINEYPEMSEAITKLRWENQ